MTSTELLSESLTGLRDKLAEVPQEHLPEIEKIREAIAAFEPEDEDADRFAKRIVGLAEAVIETRKHATIHLLRSLPVPPYDLWLPFKAANLRGSLDNEHIRGANRVVNRVLGGLALAPRDPKLTKLIEEQKKLTEEHQKTQSAPDGTAS